MNKLLDKKGFTLSELLLVVLILSIIVVVIGGGIVVVKNAYERITLKSEAQVLLSTNITKVTDELRFASEIDTSDSQIGVPTFTSGNMGYKIYLCNDESNGICYSCIASQQASKKIPLLTDKTLTSGLVPEVEYSYDKGEKAFTANIEIVHNGTVVVSQEINVVPLNGL